MSQKALSVLLVSKRTDQATKLYDDLNLKNRYAITFVETSEAAMAQITAVKWDCVVFNFEMFGPAQLDLIDGIKRFGNILQILIFTDQADPEVVAKVKDVKSLIVIEKPLLNIEKDISGLCDRLIGGEVPYQRESPRYAVKQKAEIEIAGNPHIFSGEVTDLSKKGACIQTSETAFQVGAHVKVTIELDKLEKKRAIQCEVRWVKSLPGQSIAGLRFLKE